MSVHQITVSFTKSQSVVHFTSLSVHPCPSIEPLSVRPSSHWSVYPSSLSVRPSSLCLSVHQVSVYPSNRFLCLSIKYLPVRLTSLCLSVHQVSVCPTSLSVCSSSIGVSVHQVCLTGPSSLPPVRPTSLCLSIHEVCLPVHQDLSVHQVLSAHQVFVCLSITSLSVRPLSLCLSDHQVCLCIDQVSVYPSI